MECQIYTAKLQRPPWPTSLQRWYIFGLILSKHVISSLVKYMKNQEKWQVMTYKSWLVVSNICYFSLIYGMSSFPLPNSIIFQDGYKQPIY
jgi:hypothetical protein